jgi:hypothetical protein
MAKTHEEEVAQLTNEMKQLQDRLAIQIEKTQYYRDRSYELESLSKRYLTIIENLSKPTIEGGKKA